MSVYCIGDLHGRYDLFQEALDKIQFNPKEDKMYLLGDIIDVNTGAIDIYKHIRKYGESFQLLLGNHEYNFLDMAYRYDEIFKDDVGKNIVRNIVENITEGYLEIEKDITKAIKNKNIDLLRNKKKIITWKEKSFKRNRLLEEIISLVKYFNYNEDKLNNIQWLLKNGLGIFKCTNFQRELLLMTGEEYKEFKNYLLSCKNEIEISYKGKRFILCHYIYNQQINYELLHLKSLNRDNMYVIFGHKPVVNIHRKIWKKSFDFNYREILSYVDSLNNHYYDLDFSTNGVAVLRLDDMEEFYCVKHKEKGDKTAVEPPKEGVQERKVGYKIVKGTYNKIEEDALTIVNYRDYSLEFFIWINKSDLSINYKRFDYIPYEKDFSISREEYSSDKELEKFLRDVLKNKSVELSRESLSDNGIMVDKEKLINKEEFRDIDEDRYIKKIIEIVRTDFIVNRNNEEIIEFEKFIRRVTEAKIYLNNNEKLIKLYRAFKDNLRTLNLNFIEDCTDTEITYEIGQQAGIKIDNEIIRENETVDNKGIDSIGKITISLEKIYNNKNSLSLALYLENGNFKHYADKCEKYLKENYEVTRLFNEIKMKCSTEEEMKLIVTKIIGQ